VTPYLDYPNELKTNLSGDCGHAGEAVGEAAVDVVLFADGRDSLAVIDVRQIGLSLKNSTIC